MTLPLAGFLNRFKGPE